MALRTVSRKPRRRVWRIIRRLVIRLVTFVAGRWKRRVVVVRMALDAGHGQMRACEREARVVVIERGWTPAARGVADRAISWEAGGHVIRICRPGKVCFVA